MFSPKNMTGVLIPWEYYPAAAGTYKCGQLLTISGGKLTPVADASTKTPGYLCVANVTVADGDVIPVQPIQKETIYMTELSAETATAAPGVKLQVSAGGLQVDGAAAGTFELVDVTGTAAGAEVCGRFV